MTDIIDLKDKIKYRLSNQYPPLRGADVPSLYEIKSIKTRQADIGDYDVVYWHLLLRELYQEPSEIECELLTKGKTIGMPETVVLRSLGKQSEWQLLNVNEEIVSKIQSGEIIPLPINWKYFISLPGGGTVELGTRDKHTTFYLACVVRSAKQEKKDSKEAEQFCNLLIAEANRLRPQLFNPIKKFEKAEGLKLYHLFNVYLSNYTSAKFMHEIALSQEKNLRDEFLRYDARTEQDDHAKKEHMDQFMLACGMYFSSAITYFFMALEGFINIVFHAFLKEDLRDKKDSRESNLNIEQRFDIEQKLKLTPALCSGFREEYVDSTSAIYAKFTKLKKYRNSIFHSKVEESLKSLVFIEDGFIYNVDLSKYKEQFLPSQKIMLDDDDVLDVKRIVDEIVNMILNSMTESTKELTQKYILNSAIIPFYILDNGALSLGKSQKEQNENNLAQHANQPDAE
jgi:hypothetical protein